MSLNLMLVSSLVVLSAILTVVESIEDQESEEWDQFKRQFNKSYSQEEESRRMAIFLENKRYVESHNTKAQASFKQGINPLSDMTTDEINQSRNGFRVPDIEPDEVEEGLLEMLLTALNVTSEQDEPALGRDRSWFENLISRAELDYREQGRVSRVKDQGSCGSCWAFAATGALESILAVRGRGILLSEQNLIDCSGRYGNNGCSGGLMDAALRYVRDKGIMSSRDYPYVARNGQCKARRDQIVMRVRGSTKLPRGNEILLRVALALTGPIPVAIDASARSFHSYKSGVYDDRVCKSSLRNLNHAVLLVGYGTTKTGGDYWILKNSWGRSWGDNGYIKIARGRGNQCGVATYAVLPIP